MRHPNLTPSSPSSVHGPRWTAPSRGTKVRTRGQEGPRVGDRHAASPRAARATAAGPLSAAHQGHHLPPPPLTAAERGFRTRSGEEAQRPCRGGELPPPASPPSRPPPRRSPESSPGPRAPRRCLRLPEPSPGPSPSPPPPRPRRPARPPPPPPPTPPLDRGQRYHCSPIPVASHFRKYLDLGVPLAVLIWLITRGI